MSRKNIRFFTVLLVVFALLVANNTNAAANTAQAETSVRLAYNGTWAPGITHYGFVPAQRVQPSDLSVAEQPVDQAAAHLAEFASGLQAVSASQVAGIFADEVLAYPVIQQPSGNAGFVSNDTGVVTQFSTPSQFGVTGIVAHNYLAGQYFFNLGIGNDIYVVNGDGSTAHYVVRSIRQFQALQPNSAYSDFVDLNSGASFTSTELFYEVYANAGTLVLQTCIANGDSDSWGRLFVIAEKIS